MFTVEKTDSRSNARAGILKTEHGDVFTPSYVVVGTNGKVRCLEADDIRAAKTQLIIANTYHLWREYGDEGLNSFPGIHALLDWQGPVMTDSGGFQVFSLGFLREFGLRRGGDGVENAKAKTSVAENLVRITESGVYFKPEESEEECYLDAELSIKIQEQIGADIIVAFDEPTSPQHGEEYTKKAMNRTHAWALRSLEAKQSTQKIYGVVQGGNFEGLRRESARVIGGMSFDGFAIGSTYSEGYGGTLADTVRMIEWSVPQLPADKPRHLFGVGRIGDLFAGVEVGVDTFDCVIPTREARHGRIWTSHGPVDITKFIYANDEESLSPLCSCAACGASGITRSALRKAFKEKNFQAGRWATMHNVFFFNDLMEQIRTSILESNFKEFKNSYLSNLTESKLE